MNSLSKAVSNIRMVLRHRAYFWLFLVFVLAFWALFFFLLGLDAIPWTDWNRLQHSLAMSLVLPNLFFVLAAGLLNSLLLALTVFRILELREKNLGKEAPAGLLGIGLGSIVVGCPFCGFSVAGILGISFVSSFLLPYYAHLQLLALAIVLVALYWTGSKIGAECKSCLVKTKK